MLKSGAPNLTDILDHAHGLVGILCALANTSALKWRYERLSWAIRGTSRTLSGLSLRVCRFVRALFENEHRALMGDCYHGKMGFRIAWRFGQLEARDRV